MPQNVGHDRDFHIVTPTREAPRWQWRPQPKPTQQQQEEVALLLLARPPEVAELDCARRTAASVEALCLPSTRLVTAEMPRGPS